MSVNEDARYTASDEEVIKSKARKWYRSFDRRDTDIEDIEQNLALDASQKTHLHDPGQGPREAFVGTIADRAAINLLEKRWAQKRNNRRDISFDVAGQVSLESPSAIGALATQMDVREVIKNMPADLQIVALLRPTHNEREIGEALGLTRGEVRQRLKRIKKHLEDAGLGPEESQPSGGDSGDALDGAS